MSTIPPIQPGASGPGFSASPLLPKSQDAMPTVAGSTRSVSASDMAAPGQAGRAASDIGQLLQDIGGNAGGNAQNNQIVQMLIALLIFMALLQAAQGGGSQSVEDTLGMLGELANNGSASAEGNGSVSIYIEQTTISMTSTSITAAFQSTDPSAPTTGGTLDLQA